jgi:hypothetical protein
MSKESVPKTLHQWEKILAASEANAEDLRYLQKERTELQEIVERVKHLWNQQAALAAQRQQVTRNLEEAKERGRQIAVRMRNGIRTRYGLKGEKLTEFGLRPRRGRRRNQEEETPPE